MITPAEFIAGWKQFKAQNPVLIDDEEYQLRVAKADDARLKNLPWPTKQFLLEAGLPKSFLSLIYFHDLSEGIKPIWEVYGPRDPWAAQQRGELDQYFVIGSDEQDNPICLDASNEERIVLLDHDCNFRNWQFVNSSIAHLAACLLAFGSSDSSEELKSQFENTDAPAMMGGSFWQSQLT